MPTTPPFRKPAANFILSAIGLHLLIAPNKKYWMALVEPAMAPTCWPKTLAMLPGSIMTGEPNLFFKKVTKILLHDTGEVPHVGCIL